MFKLIASIFLIFISQTTFAAELNGRVVRVHDGDTVTLMDATQHYYQIRLTGIDAPEIDQDFGIQSKKALASMVLGQRVTVRWLKQDSYNRILGKLVMQNADINLEMLHLGLAWHYKRYQFEQSKSERQLYSETEANARSLKLGLWIQTYPIAPWEWRHSHHENSL